MTVACLILCGTLAVVAIPVSGTISPATFSESQEPAGATIGVFVFGYSQSNFGQFEQVMTDENGLFQVDLSPGVWNISVNPIDAAIRGFILPERTIEVREGVAVEPVLIEGTRSSVTIRGSIKTTEGTPLPNTSIFGRASVDGQDYSVSSTSDFRGEFVLRVVPGTWNVSPGSVDGLSQIPDQSITVSENSTIEFVARVAPAFLSISPDTLPDGVAGSAYRERLEIKEEGALAHWAVDAASAPLPSGLSLEPTIGLLSGTPLVEGVFEFTVVATERFGSRSGRKTFRLSLAKDTTPPRMVNASPDRRSSLARNDSVLAIRFS